MKTPQQFNCKDYCKHYPTCTEPCDVIDILANNKKSRREKLINYNDNFLTKDYKEVLCRMQTSKEFLLSKNIEQIREMPAQHHRDIRRKAIAAMLYAEMPVSLIAAVMDRSEQNIYQQIRTAYLPDTDDEPKGS